MNMKNILTALILGAAVVAQGAGKTGSNWKNTSDIKLDKEKTVTLVPEYDLEEKEATEDGCYYLKCTVSRGKAYTIRTTDAREEDNIGLDVLDKSSFDWDAEVTWPGFSSDADDDGNIRCLLYEDDWDTSAEDGDDKSVTCYIYVTGEVGASVTISFESGANESSGGGPTFGTEENPKDLGAIGTTEKSATGSLIEGAYYFKAKLKAGNKYKFGTTGGTSEDSLSITIYGDEDLEGDPDVRDLPAWSDDGNEGIIAVPTADGTHIIVVEGFENQSFGLRYQTVAPRKPEDHAVAATLATPTAEGVELLLNEPGPGYRNDPNSGYYDLIIDEELVKVRLVAGQIYRFAVTGASTNLCLEIYEKGGSKAVAKTSGCSDPILSFSPGKTADYWVGVCQELENEDEETPTYGSCTLTAKLLQKGDGFVDAWDPMDDSVADATGLAPAPGHEADDVLLCGSQHGPHYLGSTDWVDTYMISVRDGLTYRIQASLAAEHVSGDTNIWKLGARVYKQGAKAADVQLIPDLSAGGKFVAKGHGTYYVEVFVVNGQGRDYGPYTLHSLGYDPKGADLGELTVDIGGATAEEGAAWMLVSDGKSAPKYRGGAPLLLPKQTYTVTFADVKGWTKPANFTVSEFPTVVTKRYSDDHDDVLNDAKNGDGSTAGKKVTELKPAATGAWVSRSLWPEDAADWFKVAVTANTRYDFSLRPSAKLGDATIVAYRVDDSAANVVGEGTDVSFLCRESKKTYWICVRHATEASLPSQYVLDYSRVQVGAVGFKKTGVTVKDSLSTVAVAVGRTGGKEGRVRCRYTTRAGTAVPGRHYEPQNGILEWAAGDTKDKTISIVLIPDLIAQWDGDRTFQVELATVTPEQFEADENYPVISAAETTVTIQESTKKSVGSVAFAAWGDDDQPFANAKKPAASVRAGETLRLRLDRTGGKDGRAVVTVTPTKGTAVADVNFDASAETVVWEDGDDEPKYCLLKTIDTGADYQAALGLTMKLAADKSAGEAVKVGSAVSVTIGDASATGSLEDYAAGFAKADGISVKGGKKDTWYFDAVGDLRTAPLAAGGKAELTVTLTGPGKFVCCPSFDDGGKSGNKATIAFDKETLTVPAEGAEIVRYIAKKATVKISVSRDKSDKTGSGPVLTFADLGGGQPFAWKLLPAATLVSPVAGEVLTAIQDCENPEKSTVRLMWRDLADEEIVYLFTLDADKKKLGQATALYSYEKNGYLTEGERTMPLYCSACGKPSPTSTDLEPKKTYYWRVDTAFVDADGKVVLRNESKNAWTVYAQDCGLARAVLAGGVDAEGTPLTSLEPVGSAYPVKLVQGVAADVALSCADPSAGTTLSYALVKGSKLPNGLSVKGGQIVGAPTKAGSTTSVVIVRETKKVNGKNVTTDGGTVALQFEVLPPQLAAGSFTGLLQTEDERMVFSPSEEVLPTANVRVGSLSVTAAEGGKLSAKVEVGGAKHTFSAASWTGVVPALENGQPGVVAVLTNVVKITTSDRKVHSVPNVLTLTACRGSADDPEALDVPLVAEMSLNYLSEDKKTVVSNVCFTGKAWRNNAKVASVLAGEAAFAGYYTVSLAPYSSWINNRQGHGYLTVTLDAKKSVAKYSGVLADGSTKISGSTTLAYVSEGGPGKNESEVEFSVYAAKGTSVFGGWFRCRLAADGTPYVGADSSATWIDVSSTATYHEGEWARFVLDIEPTGGYYNTLVNLQAYYLGSSFAVGMIDEEDLGEDRLGADLLGVNSDFVCYPGLFDQFYVLSGNSISVQKQAKTMRQDNKKLVDWENTVNPANLSISFKRATGLYSGQFEVWAGNDCPGEETRQTKVGTYKHQGVLLLTRDENAETLPPGDDEVVAPGFYNVPVKIEKKSFTSSLPFEIRRVERDYGDNDWTLDDWVETFPE